MRILGIDPGSRVTGYGVIETRGHEMAFVACGTIRTLAAANFSQRLLTIFEEICLVIDEHRPTVAAIEDMFIDRNPRAALKLGHARGATVVAVLHKHLQVFDYTARKVKQAVAGYGQAEKEQVQRMVRSLLQLNASPSSDAADALAVAICHAHHAAFLERLH